MVRLIVTSEDSGKKTTDFLEEMLPGLTRGAIKKMMRGGEIRINGGRYTKDYPLQNGDVVEAYVPLEFERAPLLDICYEDKNLMLVNKQPGALVTGTDSVKAPDLLSMVINYMRNSGEYCEEIGIIPFPCYRLDIYTGGLVMFAKNGDMFELLKEALHQRRIKRIFQAIIKGCPENKAGEFQHFYVKDGDDKYRVSNKKIRGAVPIYTKYRVLRTNGSFSLVEVEPVTGYMNQERAHMEAAGYPILGDNMYGDARVNRKMGVRYQALWCSSVEFTTGINNMLEYINGKQVYTNDINFPLVNI